MKIICVGGGPAGIYAALLLKQAERRHDVTVYERDAVGVTRGWGVTFWDDLIDAMRANDVASAASVADAATRWNGLEVHRQGREAVVNPGFWGHGIARSTLVGVLAQRARELGVAIAYETEVAAEDLTGEADLVVAADGASSPSRQAQAVAFGTDVDLGRNRFAWLATPRVFNAFRFAFANPAAGWLCGYAYAYSDHASTFVVEMPPETFDRLGLSGRSAESTLPVLREAFDWQLAGQPLLVQPNTDGTLPWRSFPTIRNRGWTVGNVALIGDAAHTTHYSIGFGTKLALEDAICLAQAVAAEPDVPAALRRYESQRRRDLRVPQRDADLSRRWFERAGRYLELPDEDLASLLDRRRSPLVAHLPPGLLVAGRHLVKRTGLADRMRARQARRSR